LEQARSTPAFVPLSLHEPLQSMEVAMLLTLDHHVFLVPKNHPRTAAIPKIKTMPTPSQIAHLAQFRRFRTDPIPRSSCLEPISISCTVSSARFSMLGTLLSCTMTEASTWVDRLLVSVISRSPLRCRYENV
jgi:hypothetical protein